MLYRFHIKVSWAGIGTTVGVSFLWWPRFKLLWKRFYAAVIKEYREGGHEKGLGPIYMRSNVEICSRAPKPLKLAAAEKDCTADV